MDPKAQKWYGVVAAAVVVIAALGWYFAVHQKAVAPTNVDTNATSTSATTTGQIQITGAQDTSGIQAPSLDRAYTPPSYLPAAQQVQNQKDYNTVVAQLKFDPTNHAYWLQLALYRKAAGDYTGAEEIWLFVIKRWPDDPIPYKNLTDLYLNFMHDKAKAKAILQAGVKAFPDDADLKAQLAAQQ
ncbi:MAG TPA: hypothetical protein VG984_00175 [Candidatus Paceibacterota bacterium]|nr:hypothetical protein [Candidatus Paceibacterota bacterium]